jgi:O-antigen/teichoic acid export membrane protein
MIQLSKSVLQTRLRLDVLARDRINRDTLLILAGNVARQFVGLGSSILLARGLGPAGLGWFNVLGAIGNVGSTAADFGLVNAGVSRGAQVLRMDAARAPVTMRALLILKVALAGLIVIPALIFSDALARIILPTAYQTLWLQLVLVGILVRAFGGALSAILQAARAFKPLVVSQLASSFATLLLIAALYFVARLDVATALGIGIAAGVIGALLSLYWIAQSPRLPVISGMGVGGILHEMRVLLGFSKWLWVSAIFSILAVQIDIILLNQLVAPTLVGFYSLALNLAFAADIVQQSLFAVLLPTASSLHRGEYGKYIRDNLSRTVTLSLGLLALVPFAQPTIALLYGEDFLPAADIFAMMMGVVVFDLLTMPLILLVFPLQQPRALAVSDIARVATLFIGLWSLVPIGGLPGAVIAKFFSRVAGLGVVLFALRQATKIVPTWPRQFPM